MRIELHRDGRGWHATHLGESQGDDAELRKLAELFGTFTLPCAFTALAEPELVLASIRRLNPGATVELAVGQDLVTAKQIENAQVDLIMPNPSGWDG